MNPAAANLNRCLPGRLRRAVAPWRYLERVVLPELCPACLNDGCAPEADLCEACAKVLTEMGTPRCPQCGGVLDNALAACRECLQTGAGSRPWQFALSVFPFSGTARELMHRFKYQGQTYLAAYLAGRLSRNWERFGPGAPDLLVPVPLHWFKELWRGYNQAALLASQWSRRCGVPVANVLCRRRWTRQQARLDAAARQRNLKAAFAVKTRAGVKGRHVVLIDDVFTTGATLAAAAQVLVDGGAARVSVATVARG